MLINSQWFKHANKERKGKDITRLRFFIIFFVCLFMFEWILLRKNSHEKCRSVCALFCHLFRPNHIFMTSRLDTVVSRSTWKHFMMQYFGIQNMIDNGTAKICQFLNFQLFFASFVDVNSIWKLAQRLLLFPCPAFVIQKSHIKFSRSASRYGWHRMTSINNGTSTQIVPLLYRCDSATHTILHELHSFFAVSLFFSFTCRLQGCFHIDKGIFSAIAKQQH